MTPKVLMTEVPDPASFVMKEVVVCAQCERPVKHDGENCPECTQAQDEWNHGS